MSKRTKIEPLGFPAIRVFSLQPGYNLKTLKSRENRRFSAPAALLRVNSLYFTCVKFSPLIGRRSISYNVHSDGRIPTEQDGITAYRVGGTGCQPWGEFVCL